MADFPVVPLEKIQAQFNIDMIGRNRDDDPDQANTVFVIGADRISTDLHNLVVDANKAMAKPLTLDFDTTTRLTRTASTRGATTTATRPRASRSRSSLREPIPDYHGAGDHADKILYPKLTQITQMVYQAGFSVANTERTLTRDNKGPRAGRGFAGRIDK